MGNHSQLHDQAVLANESLIPLHEYVERNAKQIPNTIAYIFYGNEISWLTFNELVNRFANFLKEFGIHKGERIGLYLQNCPQYLIGYYAIQRIGAVVVPINPMLKEMELEYLLNEGEVRGILCGQELAYRIEAIMDNVDSLDLYMVTNYVEFLPNDCSIKFPEELFIQPIELENFYSLNDILNSNESLESYDKLNIWDDTALLVFTSGTTGRPKGAILTHGNALYKTIVNARGNKIEKRQCALAVAPFNHIAGKLMGVNISVYSQLTTVVLTLFNPEVVVQAIEKYKVKMWYSIALMNKAILALPQLENRNLSTLKINMSTSFGVSVNKEIAEQWHNATGGCVMYEASYGLSETHTGDTFMPQENIKHGSCGKAVEGTTIKIVNENGGCVGPNVQGEIIIKGPGVFKGYFNREKETKEVLKKGFLFTGDIGKLDEDGYLYYLGRTKELIKCSGYSVFPDDVEAILNAHPAVLQCVIIGVPDAKRGESVKAFIVLKPNYKDKVTELEMIAWTKENMAAYKYPREVEFIAKLPTTSAGKVLRRLLKDE